MDDDERDERSRPRWPGGRRGRAGGDPMVRALCRPECPSVTRLEDGSREAMAALLLGFGQLARIATEAWLRRAWPEVLRRAEPMIRRRVLLGLRRRGADEATEELAAACLHHARESLAGAFRRIEGSEFVSVGGLMASLHLHAELTLSQRLAPFDPPPFALPTTRSRADLS